MLHVYNFKAQSVALVVCADKPLMHSWPADRGISVEWMEAIVTGFDVWDEKECPL